MLLAEDFRRHAHVCARLAEDCDDPRLAERLRAMASDLLAKAEESGDDPQQPLRARSTMICCETQHGASSWTSWSGCGAWASGSMRLRSATTR